MTPVAVACPRAKGSAAWIVRWISGAGTAAVAASSPSATASMPAGSAIPRLVSLLARIARARDSRPETVPTGQPSRSAASLCPRPSRSHRTTGARYLSGRRLSSRSISPHKSSAWADGTVAGSGMAVTCLSRDRRRPLMARALIATCWATPYSQLGSIAPGRIEPAFRASTRNVAWKASSASWWSRSTRRQTPRTIGPCRRTIASNADSSRRATNRSSSSTSERVPSAPAWKRVRRSCCAVPQVFTLTPRVGNFEDLTSPPRRSGYRAAPGACAGRFFF